MRKKNNNLNTKKKVSRAHNTKTYIQNEMLKISWEKLIKIEIKKGKQNKNRERIREREREMSSNRALSGKSATSSSLNERGSLTTPFNYNTSIIDLNFDRMGEYRALASGGVAGETHNMNDSTPNQWSGDHRTMSWGSKNDQLATSYRAGQYRNAVVDASKNRKFLITKNFRFYEPVKDAEMMAEIQLLR